MQVERSTSNPQHVFSRFSTGTRRTLFDPSAGPDRNLKYELFTFFKTNYSANLVTVCLIHPRELDQLERIAKENFLRIKVEIRVTHATSAIKHDCLIHSSTYFQNKNIPETIWPSRAFRSAQLRTKLFVVPVKDIYHVNLTFQVDDLRKEYRAGAEGYLAQLIGHKGPGGLFAHLRYITQSFCMHTTYIKGHQLIDVFIKAFGMGSSPGLRISHPGERPGLLHGDGAADGGGGATCGSDCQAGLPVHTATKG